MGSSEATELSTFELEEQVGEGELAEVWRARSGTETIALKVAHGAGEAEALAREGHWSQLCDDPALPRWLGAGRLLIDGRRAQRVENGRPFLALRWREGRPLASLDEATAAELARALACLHATGVAHGDIKPDNAIVGDDGAGWIDLGLATHTDTVEVHGGTPRYLARGDRDLGDARARDLLAFGLMLAERLDPEIAAAEAPLPVARQAHLPAPYDGIVEALLSPVPYSRPDASWVATQLGAPPAPPVRETYRRLRGTAPATDAIDRSTLRRWLVALVGEPASRWPLDALEGLSDLEICDRLQALADRRHPVEWRLADLEGAAPPPAPDYDLDALPSTVARLATALGRTPPDPAALAFCERHRDALPVALREQAADALRLAGALGRAGALLRGLPPSAVAADVHRRAGRLAAADATAAEAPDDDGRARAIRARLAHDRGEPVDVDDSTAATAEVAALVAVAKGDGDAAQRHAERARALAVDAEQRARGAAVLAYVAAWRDPTASLDHYREAAEFALQAGAWLEEATYRTGEASAAVDAGELAVALRAAERAALLWEEVLRRPGMAARAHLASAAAWAAVEAEGPARRAAEAAIARAERAGDGRAALYAWWTIADAAPAGTVTLPALEADGDDAVQLAARRLRHGEALDLERLDAAAKEASPFARLAWWGARALVADDPARVIAALTRDAEAQVPVDTLGKAMAAGATLAARVGDTDAFDRLEAARRRAAAPVLAGATGPLAEPARTCSWLRPRGRAAAMAPEQVVDLQQLVRALSERRSLPSLLDRVLDVLLLWTRAERGLLLMPNEADELVVEAARNLGRDDLGPEQLDLSTNVASRALARGEPVVAIDAMEELSHRSVHALKLRSVLAVPLLARGDVVGVAYLDDRARRGAFGDREVQWAQAIAPVAALAVADAKVQSRLQDALERAETAQAQLEETLARKASALDVAERELAATVRGTPTRHHFKDIIGQSDVMQSMLRLVDRVAPSDVSVLLRGESGSGKELVARALHQASERAEHPFVGENCGALPETLLESTLFGHVKGAFTGAHRPRVGLFEAAHRGTLFLDEIGEMSLGMQTKLLRVLEDSLVRPVGANASRRVDVRIVAATHRDLEQMVAEGTFREDLYYRLNVITVNIPPLRERASDIPLLVDHLIAKHAPDRRVIVSDAATKRLMAFPWPGNVRQLENEVRRALLLADEEIDVPHLSLPDAQSPPIPEGLHLRQQLDHLEAKLVRKALEQTSGNQTRAAKLLGVSRYGLHKMIKRLEITIPKS